MSVRFEFLDDLAARLPADEYADLMERAFNGSRQSYLKTFRAKHLSNPFGASFAGVARDGEQLVGMNFFMQWQFARGTDVLHAVQSCDTAVDPSYRGSGIFSKIFKLSMASLPSNMIRFGFPNEKSEPGLRKLGWTSVHGFNKCVHVVRPATFLYRRVLRKQRDLAIIYPKAQDRIPHLEHEEDEWLNASSHQRNWRTKRSSALLNWKLEMTPSLRVQLLRSAERVGGVLLYQLSELKSEPAYKLLTVVDLWVEPDVVSRQVAKQAIIALAKNLGASELQHTITANDDCLNRTIRTHWRKNAPLLVDPAYGWSKVCDLNSFQSHATLSLFDTDQV